MNDIENRENMVDALAAQGKTEDAVKLLLELIKEEAERKNFAKAEELRDKLYEVDAMALAEIVKASDIIEEARAGAVDQDYLQLWPDVFGSLSTEETNSIYFALEEKTVDTNQAVFTQGDHDTNLYFVTHGKLKIVHMQESKETLIKTIQPGDIAGIDTFFSISVCTTSMIALSASKLQVLKRDALAVWSAKHPNLEGKLEEHCLNREKISDLLFQKSIERRVHKRIKAAGPVGVHILNSAQKPIGKSFRGNAYDISVAGFCFYFKTPKQETARMLLGRNLHIQYVYSSGGEQKKIERIGRAIGVSYHLFNDYAIHMKFHQRVDVTTILEIEKLKMENK